MANNMPEYEPYDGDKVSPDRKCYCRGCGTYFLSTGDFDIHRFTRNKERACMTSSQRVDAKLGLIDGYWGQRRKFG